MVKPCAPEDVSPAMHVAFHQSRHKCGVPNHLSYAALKMGQIVAMYAPVVPVTTYET